jgi:hypothetical protein
MWRVDTLAPPRKSGASSAPVCTTACRPRRSSRACSPSGVHQTDDACLRAAASARAALPPRSPWTPGRGSLGTRSITVGRDEVSVAGREWSGRPPLLPIAKRTRGNSATANFALCLSTSSTQPLRQATARDEPLLRLMLWIATNWRESVPPRSTQGGPGDPALDARALSVALSAGSGGRSPCRGRTRRRRRSPSSRRSPPACDRT